MKNFLSLTFTAVCALAATAASGAPLTPQSLLDLRVVEDVEISPDGERIVYEVTHIERAENKYERNLWLIEGEKAPRPFVVAPGDDSRPRWSPDGRRLAFISTREGRPQIFILEMSGGEPWRLSNEASGVSQFAWSPDGSRIAYLAGPQVPQPSPSAFGPTAKPALVTNRLFYRMDGVPGFLPEGRSRLYVAQVRRDHFAPVGPLTNGHFQPSEPEWSADGQWIMFSTVPTTWTAETEMDSELHRVPADGSGKVEQITDRRGPDDGPIADRNSNLIAWTGNDVGNPRRMHSTNRLYVMRPDGSGRRELTASFDRNVGELQGTDAAWLHGVGRRVAFAPDGKNLLFLSSDRGLTQLYQVGVNGGDVKLIPNQMRGEMREFSVAKNGKLAAIFGSPTQPYEIWTTDQAGKTWRKRTNHAMPELGEPQLAPYEELWFDSYDGKKIQGWLIKPSGFDPSRKYPLILYVHGGPNAMYGENFYHEMQVLAGAGYVVFLTNPRGSTGYGQDFANIVQYRHPIDDSGDLLAAADAAAALGYIDEKRMGLIGGSGGGTLTAWTVAHSDKFAAAVAERPVTNFHSLIGSSDGGLFFSRLWFRDFPWRDPNPYLERSPLSFVENVTTPVMVIQSIEDYRTTMDQGLQFYDSLKMLGKEARLVLFPISSHSLSRNGPPNQRVERLELILQWFDEKLKSNQKQ